MTEQQQKVFDMIKQYISDNGCPPSFREISTHFGWSETAGYKMCEYLRRAGVIYWQEGKARSIRVKEMAS